MKKLFLIPVAAMLFAACSNETENTDNDGPVPLQISVGNLEVSTEVATRAANSAWEASDQIGVYAVATGTTTPTDFGSNKYYTLKAEAESTDATNGTTYKNFTGTDPVYLPANGSAIDVYGYYPYSGSATTPTAIPVNVSDQSSQKAIDFMTTGKVENTTHAGSTAITKTNPSCELLFTHRLTKLKFVITKGTGMTNDDIAAISSVTISKQPLTATYNIYETGDESGTNPLNVTDASRDSHSITANRASWTASSVTYEAIVYPNKNGSTAVTNNDATNHVVEITIGDTPSATYSFTIHTTGEVAPVVAAFEAGKEYTFNVTVNAASLSVTAAITPWVAVGPYAATAQ